MKLSKLTLFFLNTTVSTIYRGKKNRLIYKR